MKTKTAIIAALTALTLTASAQNWLTNGLVAYYPFNGNANDASGNGNNGTVTGATLTNDRLGTPLSAYAFSGRKPQRIETILNGDARTFSVWVKSNPFTVAPPGTEVDTSSIGGDRYIFGVGMNSPRFFGLRADIFNSDPVGKAHFDYEYTSQQGYQNIPLFDTNYPSGLRFSIDGNHWVQVVLSIRDSELVVFVNGEMVSSINFQDRLSLSGKTLSIGDFADPISGRVWNGSIDDVRIYNRALSSNEVAQLYVIESGPRVDLIKAVKPAFSYLALGTNYQLQLSGNLTNWTNYGAPFPATNMSMVYPQYWDVDNWGKLYFRLLSVP